MQKAIKTVRTWAMRSRVLHYLIAGGTAFIVEYVSFLGLFYSLQSIAVIANTASFILGLTTSFLLNRSWVFKRDEAHFASSTWRRQLFLYMGLALFNVLLTNIVISLLVASEVAAYTAKFVLMISVAGWNYFIFKKVIFR